MTQLNLYFFGAPRIELAGQPISLSHHKAMALLAYLAITRQPHARQALAGLLWPDYEPPTARAEVRRMIWVLNKSLGQGWLETDQQTVALPPQPDLWLDVARFRQLAAIAQQHAHPAGEPCPTCVAALTEAAGLAQGDFMNGFTVPDSLEFDTWHSFETESLRREVAGALERLVQLLIRRGETSFEEAIIYGRRWLAMDPLHEPAHRQLMRLYAWSGQRAAALRQYQTLVRLLHEELGIAPDEESQALQRAIEANALISPPTQPARQTEADYPGAAAPASPLPGPAAPPHNLPPQATPFIGREAVLNSLQQRLDDPAVRLITIIGPGGIGKTRLALALAERQMQPASAFSDGVYFISLAPIRSAGAMVQTIAEGLAFPLASAEEPTAQLLAYLRHRQMLLVLDNFEHLLAGVTLISQILQTAARVKILVTSRERLNLANETLWPISGLNFSPLTGVETALASEAGQFFVQCAGRVRPDFALRSDDLPHLERILQGVWGMPLAIELAAAWLNMLPLAQVAAELSHGLDLLESELRDVPSRHRSMRLVFDRSWEQLTAAEQTLFEKLSVFRGGFTREAARQITGASLRDLAGLVNKSLLNSQPESGRYELHELLRQYAEEKLKAEPLVQQSTQQVHATFYANLMQQYWVDLRSARQLAAVIAIEQDIENIRAAWRRRLAEKNSDELLKFMDSFAIVYDIRGWHQAAIALFEEAAQLPAPAGDSSARLVRGKALGYAGFYAGIIGRPDQAVALCDEARGMIEPLNRPEDLAYVLLSAALSGIYLGDFEGVIEVAQELGRLGRQTGDRWAEGISLNLLTAALVGQRRLGEAEQTGDKSLQIFAREIGDYFGLTWAALVRGLAALAQGAYAEARTFYERSLEAAQTLNYRRTTQQSYDNLGDVAFNLNELEQAERYFRLSLEISEETGQTREMLGTLYDLARVRVAQNNKAEAVELLAVVVHHPLSNLPFFLRTEETSLQEAAERLRAALEAELEPQVYRFAWSKKRTWPIETVVAGLLRGSRL